MSPLRYFRSVINAARACAISIIATGAASSFQRDDLVRGFQLAKDQYVLVTEEALESLEAEATGALI